MSINKTVHLKSNFKMVKKKTVDGWGIDCIECKLADDGLTVTEIVCKVCRDFYSSHRKNESTIRGFLSQFADNLVRGTSVIKKCNVVDHISKSTTHRQAVLGSRTRETENGSDTGHQSTLHENVRRYNVSQRAQIVRKFQLAHFLIIKGRPFKDYVDIAKFERRAQCESR